MDREPMTDKERDDALIAEKKRLAYFLECKEGTLEAEAMFRRAAALLRGDEQPKPDRAEVLAEEIWPYLRSLSRDRLVPILNRHFDELRAEWEAERPAVVVPSEIAEALARMVSAIKMAGVGNLSKGVQLGQISWSVKCNDAIEWAEKALSQLDGAKGGE